jgi:hypothetical protein
VLACGPVCVPCERAALCCMPHAICGSSHVLCARRAAAKLWPIPSCHHCAHTRTIACHAYKLHLLFRRLVFTACGLSACLRWRDARCCVSTHACVQGDLFSRLCCPACIHMYNVLPHSSACCVGVFLKHPQLACAMRPLSSCAASLQWWVLCMFALLNMVCRRRQVLCRVGARLRGVAACMLSWRGGWGVDWLLSTAKPRPLAVKT